MRTPKLNTWPDIVVTCARTLDAAVVDALALWINVTPAIAPMTVMLESTGGGIVPSITDIGAIAGVTLIQSASASTTAASNVRAQVTTMSGQVLSFGVRIPGTVDNRHRVSWRLLNRD